MRIWAFAAVLLLAATARAQETTVCDPNQRDCGCEKNWGCWELFYTTRGTILGMKATLTQVEHGEGIEHGAVTTYATEHYGTRGVVSGHVAVFGGIGGGSAGTEGNLGGTLDFGLRAPVTETSGPFVRFGFHGWLLGNHALRVSMLEPMQGRIGYQHLDGDTLLEAGLTTGFVAAGRYAPAAGSRDLSDTPEVGVYGALHVRWFRVDAGFLHMPADASSPGTAVNLLRVALCSYLRLIALCTDLLYVHGDANFGSAGVRAADALYAGFTVGLTP